MKIIKKTNSGVEYLIGLLKEKVQVSTRAVFWKIPHNSKPEEICLKIGSIFIDDLLEFYTTDIDEEEII
jgi:hypothetical protein